VRKPQPSLETNQAFTVEPVVSIAVVALLAAAVFGGYLLGRRKGRPAASKDKKTMDEDTREW
jgi:hypothetical protein